ncbi:MAG: STAS domain-containing protein [Pseudomonadales bacterium]|nr:STAS domain-containing protein [Pseudomonadales bacterium]
MDGRILVAHHDGVYLMKFTGDVRVTLCTTVDSFLDSMFSDSLFKSVIVDLSEAECIDSTSLGILAKLSIQAQSRFDYLPVLVSTNPDITRVLKSMGFEDVFQLIEDKIENAEQLGELPKITCSDNDIRLRVIEAHRILMEMNENNRATFHNLVEMLEAAS